MIKAVISGTGLYTPPAIIENDELVEAFNQYVELFNSEHADEIARGEVAAFLPQSKTDPTHKINRWMLAYEVNGDHHEQIVNVTELNVALKARWLAD